MPVLSQLFRKVQTTTETPQAFTTSRSECSDSRSHPSLQQLSVRHAALDGASQVDIHESEMSVPTFPRFKGEKP